MRSQTLSAVGHAMPVAVLIRSSGGRRRRNSDCLVMRVMDSDEEAAPPAAPRQPLAPQPPQREPPQREPPQRGPPQREPSQREPSQKRQRATPDTVGDDLDAAPKRFALLSAVQWGESTVRTEVSSVEPTETPTATVTVTQEAATDASTAATENGHAEDSSDVDTDIMRINVDDFHGYPVGALSQRNDPNLYPELWWSEILSYLCDRGERRRARR